MHTSVFPQYVIYEAFQCGLCMCIFVSAFNLDNEQPDYDMDSEDETLLNRLNRKMEIKPLQFEIMVDRLEKASSSQVLSCVKKSLRFSDF